MSSKDLQILEETHPVLVQTAHDLLTHCCIKDQSDLQSGHYLFVCILLILKFTWDVMDHITKQVFSRLDISRSDLIEMEWYILNRIDFRLDLFIRNRRLGV
jgi:hypothetical protein